MGIARSLRRPRYADQERSQASQDRREAMEYFAVDDKKKIGGGLTGFGLFFMFMGVMFFFDRSLLAMGNILFLSGVTLLVGVSNAFNFFFTGTRLPGSLCF